MRTLMVTVFLAFIAFVTPTEAAAPYEFVEEVHTIKDETLEDLVQYIIEHNTYGERTREDCLEALYELNPCLRDGIVEKGDKVTLTYWRKNDTEQ